MMQYPSTDSYANGMVGNFLSALLHGGKSLGYRSFTFNDAAAKAFSDIADPDGGGPLAAGIPSGAVYAICVIEADATQADQARVARFRCDNTAPTAAEGMPLGDNGSFEVKGDNLNTFKIIGITAGKTHTVRVEFYGAG